MDILQLYQDYTIDFVTEGHKHARQGWVNTTCPFCTGNPGYHLGYDLLHNYFYCWRCGWHPITPTLALVLNIRQDEVRRLLRQYGLYLARHFVEPMVEQNKKPFQFPTDTVPLLEHHKRYLEERGYDVERIERVWDLKSTGPVGRLDEKDYKNRILIPFYWNGTVVSFTSRNTQSASHEKRYKTCPKDRERVHMKEILYGRQEEWRETGILVEGPTDVWRMGTSSFAVSGIQYTSQQVRLISKSFKRVAVMFDDDPQARIQATKIVAELKFRGVDAFKVDIEDDPGSMKQTDADYLVKQLIG